MVSGKPPHQASALPPTKPLPRAAPKCISGRTSYLRVRLAFHPYPQVIRAFCNRHRFGPPRGLTRASACPWIAHSVSGRFHATDFALFRLAFAAAPGTTPLASPHRITRRSVLQKVRRQGTNPLRLFVGAGFQDLFHPPLPGCFSPFPHGTVHYRFVRVTSLGGWSPQLPAGCRVSRRTHGMLAQSPHFRLRGSHPLWRPVPAAFG